MRHAKFYILDDHKIIGHTIIGIAFLVLSFLTVKFFAPSINSNAKTNTAEYTVGPNTISMSNDDTVSINVVPSATQTIYTGTNTLSITNSCAYGATVTLTTGSDSTDEKSNNLVREGADNLTKVISPTTSTSLSSNSWGYSTNGSTFYAVPAKDKTPATIYNSYSATTDPVTLNVTYGVKVNNQIPAGNYTNDVIYTVAVQPRCFQYNVIWDLSNGTRNPNGTYPTSLNYDDTIDLSTHTPTKNGYTFTGWTVSRNGAVIATYTGNETAADLNPIDGDGRVIVTAGWRQNPVGIHSITTMQEMTPEICDATTTPSTQANPFDYNGSNHGDNYYIPRTKLTDTRDGKTYLVSKLADGNCWMSQNLEIDFDAQVKIEIAYASGGTTMAYPDNRIQTQIGVVWQDPNSWRGYKPQSNERYYWKGTDMASEPHYGSDDDGTMDWEKAGNYYNWYAAGGGNVQIGGSNTANASICPKGWMLPPSSGNKSFTDLFSIYNVPNSGNAPYAIAYDPLNFIYAGFYTPYNADMDNQGRSGYYWTSNAQGQGSSNVFSLEINTNGSPYLSTASSQIANNGFSIRCVAI